MWLKVTLVVVGILVGLPLLLALVGLFLPRDHVATLTVRHDVPVERVWALVSDPPGWPSWNRDVTEVKRLEDRDGRPVWRLEGKRGGFALQIDEVEPKRRFVTRIVDETAFGGTWTWELATEDAGTRLTLTEHGEVHNLIFRTLSRFVFDQRATIEAWNRALASACATP
jgi:uncharacterized protein YndB with AHSA1/START domain